MNIFLSQLDHVSYHIAEIECTYSCGIGSDYYANGFVIFNFDNLRLSIQIEWTATLTPAKSSKTIEGFLLELIPRIELTKCFTENFPWYDQVESAELENWLNEFMSSCRIYDDIVNCLPLPQVDDFELEDCLADRSFMKGM